MGLSVGGCERVVPLGVTLTSEPWIIITIRGVAGVFSALSMISASLWLRQHKGHHKGAPILFAGVGAGIFLSAEILAVAEWLGLRSPGLWWVLELSSAVLGGTRGSETAEAGFLARLKLDRLPGHIRYVSASACEE